MVNQEMSRRTLLKGGGAALAGLSALQVTGPAHAFPGEPGEEVIPWVDQPPPPPFEGDPQLLKWETLDSYFTDPEKFFIVSHYDNPAVDAAAWRLGIAGLVARPQSLSLADLMARPRREVTFTLECSGNHGFPFVIGAIGNARWAGTPLAPLLQRAGVLRQGTDHEVVFWGADSGQVAIRDNAGVVRSHASQPASPLPTDIDLTITEQFARSMSLDEALDGENLLCYEMNGVPLPREHGFPLRLIAPGWYGVANVKWLTRIEVDGPAVCGALHGARIRDHPRAGARRQNGLDVQHRQPHPAEVRAGQGDAPAQPVHDPGRGVGRADRRGRGADRRRALDDRRPRLPEGRLA